MEDMTDLLGVLLPTLLGVGMVLGTVIIVFWIGSGQKRSYEEAKAQASLKAEQAIKEKEKTSPKPKKPRKNFRKKKADESRDEVEPAPRKGILKTTPPAAPHVETPPERSAPNKVGFKLDSSEKEEGTPHQANPPTPYPSKDASLAAGRPVAAAAKKPPQPIFDEEEEKELEPAKPTEAKKPDVAAGKKKQATVEKPPPKPSQAPQKPSQKPPQGAQNPPQPHMGQPEPAEQVVVPKSSAQKRPGKVAKSKLVVGSGGK